MFIFTIGELGAVGLLSWGVARRLRRDPVQRAIECIADEELELARLAADSIGLVVRARQTFRAAVEQAEQAARDLEGSD